MVHLTWYGELGIAGLTQEGAWNDFSRSLLLSNRGPDFFVDWSKVEGNVQQAMPALALLSSVHKSPNPKNALTKLLQSAYSALPVIPLLVAWRETEGKVYFERDDGSARILEMDFSGRRAPTQEQAERISDFCEAAGVLSMLSRTNDLVAYFRGVEVGMDTNARKNRSGSFMEDRVVPLIQDALARESGWREVRKQAFAKVCPEAKREQSDVASRTFDFMAQSSNRKIAFETNFYNEVGSKPLEIVSSYLHQAEELRRYGWEFVWITDGPAWADDPIRMRDAFEKLPAVLNLSQCRRGVLSRILQLAPAA